LKTDVAMMHGDQHACDNSVPWVVSSALQGLPQWQGHLERHILKWIWLWIGKVLEQSTYFAFPGRDKSQYVVKISTVDMFSLWWQSGFTVGCDAANFDGEQGIVAGRGGAVGSAKGEFEIE
jgi:hypothetical protein